MNDTSFEAMFEEIEGLGGIDPQAHAEWGVSTKLVHGYRSIDEATGAVTAPLFLSTTYAHPAFGASTGYCYDRCGNPTRLAFEDAIAQCEGGCKAFAFGSGMTAVATLLKLLSPGDRVLVGDDLYGGTYRLFSGLYERYGISFEYLDMSDLDAVRTAMDPSVKLLFVETPTNPSMKVADIAQLAGIAHEGGALLAVDNTFLTFYYQRPLDLGADIVVYSATKYLCGHNDVMAGLLVVKDDSLIEPLYTAAITEGGVLPPFECWLLLRSLKTLGVRLDAQSANAARVVEALKADPHVERVVYPGDPTSPYFALSSAQADGFGAMVSFYTDTPERAVKVLENVKLILFAESLGGVESLITYPRYQTHSAMAPELLDALGIDDRLLRLSVGLEDAKDLIADLQQALA